MVGEQCAGLPPFTPWMLELLVHTTSYAESFVKNRSEFVQAVPEIVTSPVNCFLSALRNLAALV